MIPNYEYKIPLNGDIRVQYEPVKKKVIEYEVDLFYNYYKICCITYRKKTTIKINF